MKRLSLLLLPMLLLAACRGEEPVLPSNPWQVTPADPDPGEIKGFFVLNEGNMGSNKATLDWFDYQTGVYHRNIFPERNPGVARELGDVGNDIQIHGDRLYIVVNCSNLVEVMDVRTAAHIGVVSIPNCRHIVFNDGYAYVSSYAGPVQPGEGSRLGYVSKIDLETLREVDRCTVGYQPEEMVVAGGKLYVANSGGYRAPGYDNTVSVVDLATFTETDKIEVAPNLHDMELDGRGNIWAASRGDNGAIPSKLFTIDSRTGEVTGQIDRPVGNMTMDGDMLYLLHSDRKNPGGGSFVAIDTRTGRTADDSFIKDGTGQDINLPYGLAVNPATGEILVTDAKDYLTPGKLHCYTPEGTLKWSATTGDIPAHIAFSTVRLQPLDEKPSGPGPGPSAHITRVIDFMPAVGQYVNLSPAWREGDSQQAMNEKVLAAIGGGRRGAISLGGWGGYVVVGFDHTIINVPGLCDFRVLGNAFDGGVALATGRDASSEPGVIMVALDANGNGAPDDEWYEIAGSAHTDPSQESWYDRALAAGNDVETIAGYEITYYRPGSEPASGGAVEDYIRWEDNLGNSGYKPRNEFHTQSYYPQWAGEKITFRGTRLPQNGVEESAGNFVLYRFRRGYADNAPNADDASAIDIDWAVDSAGQPISLPGVDFIKIYTGVDQQNGPVGECSTEIAGVEDLHILGIEINSL